MTNTTIKPNHTDGPSLRQVYNLRREYPVPSLETLLETAVKNAEVWRTAYTQAQQQCEWKLAFKAAEQVAFWTKKAAAYAALQEK